MTLLTIAIGQFDIKINSVVNSRDGWRNLKFHGRKYKSPLGNKDRKNYSESKYCNMHGKTLGFETNKLVSNYETWLLDKHCFLCLE